MKSTSIVDLCLLLLASPIVAQAQFTYTASDGTITITGYTGTNGSVTVPSETNGIPVTSIGNSAFFDCRFRSRSRGQTIYMLVSVHSFVPVISPHFLNSSG
jgi:hypothetical protein